jgi:haloalkane dehalogenase
MPEAFRTPDERFADLPGFPFEPSYREVDGLRLAHIDEGDGEPIVLLHGQPTWSYLYRKVIPPLLEAGHRCIAPDYAGFGRSDKPTELAWYSFDRHCQLTATLLEDLDIRGATAVLHDWGGNIGFRLAVEHPERIARIVILDTGIFTGKYAMPEPWLRFRDFVERTEDVPVSMLVSRATARGMSDEVAAAYDAPYPNAESKAGVRAFPLILPTTPDAPGAAAAQRVMEAMHGDERPKLTLWADSDFVIPFEAGVRFAELVNAPPPEKIENASHFLQEDAGEEIGRRIADWLSA